MNKPAKEFCITMSSAQQSPSLRRLGGVLLLIGTAGCFTAEESVIDLELARQYFNEAREIGAQDGGDLWGKPLSGPLLLVDSETRFVVANQADTEGLLKSQDEVWIGVLPVEEGIANTSYSWAGVRWTRLMWPLPTDRDHRRALMAHEMWHRIQDDLGFPAANPSCSHLDSRHGRTWLQLEWRALRKALLSPTERHQAAADAVCFRVFRRAQLDDQARADEVALEMNEGLAEYTGMRLAYGRGASMVKPAVDKSYQIAGQESYVRSFAYATGPAYGILLDELSPGWREHLGPEDDLALMLADTLKLEGDLQSKAMSRAESYDLDSIEKAEAEREKHRQQLLASLRQRFIEGPVLLIPLRNMQVNFNPNNLQPLDDLGTVYPTMRVSDDWGILSVTGGALLSKSWQQITVPAPVDPDQRPLQGDGWTLDLAEGVRVVPGKQAGDLTLQLP
jgi:hypothetical protein